MTRSWIRWVLQGPGVRDQGPGPAPRPMTRIVSVFTVGIAFFFLFAGCGIKAPPQPREFVVPAPVDDVAVAIVPDGLEITFTLPSKSLGGFPLEVIAGYRILREGPDGKDVREDVRFSVSEMKKRTGKRVAFMDDPPQQAGTYRYCVIPLDVYGSHPSRRQTGEHCWEGFLSDEGPPP